MAKKKIEATESIYDRFAEFKEIKNIDYTTIITVMKESFLSALHRMYGDNSKFNIVINPQKGDVEIMRYWEIVPDGEVKDSQYQISQSQARESGNPNPIVGDDHASPIIFDDFGRRNIVLVRQSLQSKLLEIQKKAIYDKFLALEGQLVSGEVYQTWSRETLLLDAEKNEMILPKSESIPRDYFRKGETVQAIVLKVDKENKHKVTLSRTSELFLRRLFERDVPEIADGLINIKAVARIPGERAKIAVESYDDRIDPVGACVGPKGSRIHGIVRELRNENIDVINYTSNPQLFIQRALSPAKISSIRLDPELKKAEVFLRPEEVSLAIGKNGSNIKLAAQLTGYNIDVYRDAEVEAAEEDIYIDEFKDEIDEWVIDQLKTIGLTTAKSVLRMPKEEIIEKADLEEETVEHLINVLNAEFED